MRQVKEVLRLRLVSRLSQRDIALAVGLGKSSVSAYLDRAAQLGLSWETVRDLDDAEVERRLFDQVGRHEPSVRVPIDLAWVHREMRRPGVTLQLLWSEYAEAAKHHGDGVLPYQYSQFCDAYASHRKTLSPVMRQVHRAGETLFIDFSGVRPSIVDPLHGEVMDVELYVAVMGASNYTYAEATRSQQLAEFVGATVRAFEFFGAVPQIAKPDQLRSAVSRPDRYEPEINTTFAEMGAHYGVAIVPARPRKPRDKAKVEVGVQIAQRWILASLRNRTLFSLDELNAAIAERLMVLNDRTLRGSPSRRTLFESIDLPAMKPLPATRFEFGAWKFDVGVPPDYMVTFDEHRYSVPSTLIGQRVDLRATATTIEILHNRTRVALHVRAYGSPRTPVIAKEHRPRSHEDYGAWPPERFVRWASTVGPHVAALIEALLASSKHPELRYRSCLGVLRLAKSHGDERVDAACQRALAIGAPNYRSVSMMLKHRLERAPLLGDTEATNIPIATNPMASDPMHEHVRGADYFDKEETR
jgi:transposase